MSSMRTTMSAAACAALLLGGSQGSFAQEPATPMAIQQQLEGLYPPAKATADGTDLVTAGAVLVLRKDNLLMCKADMPLPTPNTYKNGAIIQNGFIGMLGHIGIHSTGPGAASNRIFVTGEKFWVTRIQVDSEGVVFQLLSDPVSDTRYHASLKFPFAKGPIPALDQVSTTVGEVLKTDSGDAAPAQAVAAATPAPAPAPAPAETKTIAVGQTKEQVAAMFGQPQRIVQLGAKEIDYYPDMKVTFVKNKVADVQ